MQALPGDGLRKVGRGGVQRGAREPGRIAAVERIAEQRMAEGGKVHADLVRAPGARRDAQERAAVPLGEDGIVRDGRLTAGRRDAPGRTVVRAGDGQVDRAARRQPRTAGDGEIGAPEAIGVQHAAQPVASAAIITGPEGGFAEFEADMARKLGMHICSMGERILRCETAPVVALTALMYGTGNL